MRIQIHLTPEIVAGKKQYYWVLINDESKVPCNNGFGWEESIVDAFTSAKNYYDKIKVKQQPA